MAYRMLDVLFMAFAQIVPERMPATGEGGPSAISLSGYEGTRRWLVTEGLMGSWGGRSARDGIDGLTNPGAGLTNMPVELLEARYPLRVERYGFVTNSGGAGRRRGGMAMTRSYRILGEQAMLTVRSDRRAHHPPGLFGGLSGSPSLNILEHDGNNTLMPVMPMRTTPLQRGDLFTHVAPGAGGFGPPLEREPQDVASDVADGRITVDFAQDVYGVVLTENGAVDVAATAACRADLGRESEPLVRRQLKAFLKSDPSREALSGAFIAEAE